MKICLSIIILTYNSSDYIVECLTSIYEQYKKEINSSYFELIVCDNASDDDTVSKIKNSFDLAQDGQKSKIKNLIVIRNEENMGFAKGINEASKKASGEYLLFLNPDIVVLDSHFEKAIDIMQKKAKVGIVGGKILNEQGNEQSAGTFYTVLNVLSLALGLENVVKVRYSPHRQQFVDFVSGGFMFVRKEVFERVGGFDEDYFIYVEDMDLCFRARSVGFKTFFTPYVRIKHYGQGSSSRSFAVINIYKGIISFSKKHKASFSYQIIRQILLTKARVLSLLGRISNNSYLSETYEEAYRIVR